MQKTGTDTEVAGVDHSGGVRVASPVRSTQLDVWVWLYQIDSAKLERLRGKVVDHCRPVVRGFESRRGYFQVSSSFLGTSQIEGSGVLWILYCLQAGCLQCPSIVCVDCFVARPMSSTLVRSRRGQLLVARTRVEQAGLCPADNCKRPHVLA